VIQNGDAARRLAIDIGGTFTDVVAMVDGHVHWTKVLTTHPDPTDGFLDGLRRLGAGRVGYLGHGTTLATNALLTGSGARTALITTRGFRDVLEIRRTHRRTLFDIYEEVPAPLVPRDARFEVTERTTADGGTVTPMAEDEVRQAARCIGAGGFDAVAVCYLFSFANPEHERRTRRILEEDLPALRGRISLSSDVLPLHREYERTSTTAVSASLMPLLKSYFDRLEARVRAEEPDANLLIMQNTGGLVTPSRAGDLPVLMLLSGPAGGATATSFLGRLWQQRRLLAFDMGGTSTDVSAVVDSVPDTRLDFEIGGYDVSYPSVDIHTIGAGGGSQARVDPHGRLTVGPTSSGSAPGPVCYGRGGEVPTVTDASLVLGYLGEDQLLGGEINLDADAAARALERSVAVPLGMDLHDAARGILAIANSNMVHALHFMSIQRGRDPREYVLVPFGGAGPIHAAALAGELSMGTVVVPPVPGCTSAIGILAADVRHDLVRALHRRLTTVAPEWLRGHVDDLSGEARRQLLEDGIPPRDVRVIAAADLRYVGQAYELTVPLPVGDAGVLRARLAARFHREHRRRYGHAFGDERVEVVNLRVSGIGLTPKPPLDAEATEAPTSLLDAHAGDRIVHLDAGQSRSVPVFERSMLRPGLELPAPSLVVQLDATTFVPPGARASVDRFGSIVMQLRGRL
jgi:N-methylhydantoinase A